MSEIEAFQWTGPESEDVLVDGFFERVSPDLVGDFIRFKGNDLYLYAGKDSTQRWCRVPVGHVIVRNRGDLSYHWVVDPGVS